MIRLTVLFILISTAAFAQDSGQVSIPWGDWIVSAVDTVLPVLLSVLTAVSTYVIGTYVPYWLQMLAGQRGQERVNQLLEKAVSSAIAQTKSAVGGKVFTIPVTNEVLRRAMQYAVDLAPGLIRTATGDNIDNLRKMIMARMEERGIIPHNYDNKISIDATEGGKTGETSFQKKIEDQMKGNSPSSPQRTTKEKFKFDDAIKKHLG